MENQHDDSSDNDKRMMNSFERYSDDTKEKKKKAKKKRQQQDNQEKRKSDERRTEEAKNEEARRPSLLDALIKAEPVLAKKEGAEKKQSKDAPAQETEATAENEQKPELSNEERRAAAEEYIARRQEQLAAEVTEQPEEAAEVQANRTFLQRLADRLRDSKSSPDEELLQGVTDETVAELHAATDDGTGEVGQAAKEAASSGEVNQQRYEDDYMVVVEQDDNEHLRRSKKPPVVPPPITPNIIDAATLASGNQAAEPTSDFGDRPSGNRLSQLGTRPERVSSASSETPDNTEVRGEKKHSSGGEFLLGAFVGYLFGRRRGRITAESEQVPERQKLEKEVRQLQSTIEQYEGKVRSAAAHGLEAVPQRNEQPDNWPVSEKTPAPEVFVPSILRKEKGAETPAASEVGQASAEQAKTAEPIAPERIRTMPLTEVLREAEQVDYRGTSLKGLYEQGFLNEARLRETMRLYLAGERYEQRLEQHIRASAELVAPRRSYEHESEPPQTAKHEDDTSKQASAAPMDETEKASQQPSKPVAANEQASWRTPQTKQTSGRHLDTLAIRQASIGAAIGIVFVIVVIIASSLR